MAQNILNRKAENKSWYPYFTFQHSSAHFWILLKWGIKLYLFLCKPAGLVIKFTSTSFPNCSYKRCEKEVWVCLMYFALKYTGLQRSDWASWVSGRTHTITIEKPSRCPGVEFLFFCLMIWPTGQGTADRAGTLLYISVFRVGFANEVLHAATFLSWFYYLEVKTHICHFHVE